MKPNSKAQSEVLSEPNDSWLELVQEQVASLPFGVVPLVVHDSRIVQIERTEKARLDDKER
jgi:hypothetical protein